MAEHRGARHCLGPADGRDALGALAPEHSESVAPARRALGAAERERVGSAGRAFGAAKRQHIGPAQGALAADSNQGVGSAQRPLGAPQAGLVQVLVARHGVATAEGRAVVLDPVGHTGATTRAAHTSRTSQRQAER